MLNLGSPALSLGVAHRTDLQKLPGSDPTNTCLHLLLGVA